MKHLLYNAADVRAELYRVWNDIRERQNEHCAQYARNNEPHPKPCRCCHIYDDMQLGVNEAIRHFGGKVRR